MKPDSLAFRIFFFPNSWSCKANIHFIGVEKNTSLQGSPQVRMTHFYQCPQGIEDHVSHCFFLWNTYIDLHLLILWLAASVKKKKSSFMVTYNWPKNVYLPQAVFVCSSRALSLSDASAWSALASARIKPCSSTRFAMTSKNQTLPMLFVHEGPLG